MTKVLAQKLTVFWSPQSILARFSFRQTYKGALLFAVIAGVYVASKAQGFVSLYPDAVSRAHAAQLYTNDVSIKALLGIPYDVTTIPGLVQWNSLDVLLLVGVIWGMLLATKRFRGEEQQGRAELFLAGQTTAVRAAASNLLAMGGLLALFFVVSSVAFIAIGHNPSVGFSAAAALLFSLSLVAVFAVFMLIGAVASQLFPTRSQATMFAVAICVATFALKAVGSITSARWALDLSPFGWSEQVRALNSHAHPGWILPSLAVVAVLMIVTVVLAKRDLGDSVFADRDTAKAKTVMLTNPLRLGVRLTLGRNIAWFGGVATAAFLYGSMTEVAAKEFTKNTGGAQEISKIAGQMAPNGAKTYLGIVYMLIMLALMFYAVSAINALRNDESEGFLDNLLVRPIGRLRWLYGRLLIILGVLALMSLSVAAIVWLGVAGHNLGVTRGTIVEAGLNALVSVVFVLGLGVFAFGLVPRRLSLVCYGAIGWSFLVVMLGSGLSINHWILDTSLLHQVVFAPAADPNWHTNAVIVLLGLALATAGVVRFNKRDLQGE